MRAHVVADQYQLADLGVTLVVQNTEETREVHSSYFRGVIGQIGDCPTPAGCVSIYTSTIKLLQHNEGVFMNVQSFNFMQAGTVISVTLILLGLGTPASQAILVTRNVNVTLNAANVESYDLDVDLNGTPDFTFTAAYVPDPTLTVGFDVVDFPFGSNNAVVVDATTFDGFPTVSRLAPGAVVYSADIFSIPSLDQGNLFFFDTIDPPSGNFDGETGFVGLRFDGPGGTLYGFAQVTVNNLNDPDHPLDLTIGEVGFNDVIGAPIEIPAAVPEPRNAPLFGVGLVGLLLVVARSKFGVAMGTHTHDV